MKKNIIVRNPEQENIFVMGKAGAGKDFD